MELRNNTILITGGTSGIGLELATRLLDFGNTVLITGRDQSRLDQTKRQHPLIHTFQSDVSDPLAISLLFKQVTSQFPELNILINNAGIMRRLNLHDAHIDLEDINREIEINLSGPIRMIQQFLPHLKTKQTAAIVNVTSGLALIPFPLSPVYSAAKSGLRAYTRTLRVQLKHTPIKVFELLAPATKTPLNDAFKGDVKDNQLMDLDKMVDAAIRGLQKDKLEIFPGLAGVLRIMSRIAPGFMFKMMSKTVEPMLAGIKE